MSDIRVDNLYDRHIFVRKGVVRFNYFALILIHETRDFLIVISAAGYSSFPRKRESRAPGSHQWPLTPAFAGVTTTTLI